MKKPQYLLGMLMVLALFAVPLAFSSGVIAHAEHSSNNNNLEDNNNENINDNSNDSNDDNSNVNDDQNSNDNSNVNDDQNSNDDSQDNEGKDGEDDFSHHLCSNSLRNGMLYMIGSEATVYLASDCQLKPFRGEAAFHARGMKFENINKLDALPNGVTISTKPVVPAEGTLVQGDGPTVWFVDHNGKRKGFTSKDVFEHLGFSFDQVKHISESDLETIDTDGNVDTDQSHPDGSLVKCTTSGEVDVIVNQKRFPFANAEAFTRRGHSFDNILVINCEKYNYQLDSVISQ